MSELTEIFSKAEDERYNTLKAFYVDENLNFKTDLNDSEIAFISLVEFFDKVLEDEFNIKLSVSKLTKLIKEHKVSRNRLGRAEAVSVLRGAFEEEKKEESIKKRLLGL